MRLLAGSLALSCVLGHPVVVGGSAARGPTAIIEASALTREILESLGAFLARNPNVSLTALRCAAAATLIDLRSRYEPRPIDDAEILHSPQVVLLEAAEMRSSAGPGVPPKSEEIVR